MTAKQAFTPDRLISKPQAEADFVASLARHQDAINLSDTAFAALVGISESGWRHTKAGRLSLGIKLLFGGAEMVSRVAYQAAEASLARRYRGKKGKAA